MTKYTFVVLASEKERFVERLQELGMVDVTSTGWEPSEDDRALMSLAERHRAAVEYLRALAASKEFTLEGKPFDTGAEAFDRYEAARQGIARTEAEIARYEKALAEAAPFGDVDPAKIRELEAHGVSVEFLLEAAGVDTSAGDVRLPDESRASMRAHIKELQAERHGWDRVLADAAASIPAIEADREMLLDKVQFSRTLESGEAAAEGSLVVMEAWARERQAPRVDEMLEAHPAVVYIKERPTPDDETPVELRNSKVVRPFEFISDMYARPRYGTMDLTRWFAPFYMLFFAFCLADAGYGMLIFSGGLFVTLKSKGAMQAIGKLSMWCGGAAVVFGFFAGSVFGVNIKEWGMFEWAEKIFFPSDNDMFLFVLALGLGVFQILFGMALKVITTVRAFGLKYALSTIGWMIVIATGVVMALPSVVPMMFPKLAGLSLGIPRVAFFAAMGVGVFMMLFLNNPGKNPLVNLGGGLWNTYNDVTGFLSDALSYIRLFAIGLSGGVLATVFNDLATGMSPDIPVVGQIVTLIILLIGHGLNLFMSTLSSMVHPLRLTFVEFYKNAGFEASTRVFTPLKQTKNNNKPIK
jgi:V/A-type H+-transporting ATPase subunit I